MTTTLSSLKNLRATLPPHVLAYGQPKTGKATLAAELPARILLQCEDSTSGSVELWGGIAETVGRKNV